MVKNLPATRETRFDPWLGKIPWRREWLPTPVFLPGESCGQRNLVGYRPWGRRVRRDWATNTLHTIWVKLTVFFFFQVHLEDVFHLFKFFSVLWTYGSSLSNPLNYRVTAALQTQALYVGCALLSSQKAQCKHLLASPSSPGTASSLVLFCHDQLVMLSLCEVYEGCGLENLFLLVWVYTLSLCRGVCVCVYLCICKLFLVTFILLLSSKCQLQKFVFISVSAHSVSL